MTRFCLLLKNETLTGGTNSMPFLVFRREHLWSTSGVICGPIWGSFAVRDHLRRCTEPPFGILQCERGPWFLEKVIFSDWILEIYNRIVFGVTWLTIFSENKWKLWEQFKEFTAIEHMPTFFVKFDDNDVFFRAFQNVLKQNF